MNVVKKCRCLCGWDFHGIDFVNQIKNDLEVFKKKMGFLTDRGELAYVRDYEKEEGEVNK